LLDAVYKQSAALPTLQYVQVGIFLGEEYLHAVSTRGNLINYWLEEHSAKYVRLRCAGELAFAKPTNHAGYLKIPEAIQRRMKTILSFRITFKEREDPSNEPLLRERAHEVRDKTRYNLRAMEKLVSL
jgi:hypothetical protein